MIGCSPIAVLFLNSYLAHSKCQCCYFPRHTKYPSPLPMCECNKHAEESFNDLSYKEVYLIMNMFLHPYNEFTYMYVYRVVYIYVCVCVFQCAWNLCVYIPTCIATYIQTICIHTSCICIYLYMYIPVYA